MNIIEKNLRAGKVTIQTQSLDDVWVLYKIIEVNDSISGQTTRKIKIGDGDKNAKYSVRTLELGIIVEKIDYDQTLRVSGKISEGPADISRGDYHTFDIDERTLITITKKQWLTHQITRLEQMIGGPNSILCVLFDRENAMIGVYSPQGFKQLTTLQSQTAKKGVGGEDSTHYIDLTKLIVEYTNRLKPLKIICGSALFWQGYLQKQLNTYPQISAKTVYTEIHALDKAGVDELLKSKEFSQIAGSELVSKQVASFEELLRRVSKGELATYGYFSVKEAVDMSNASVVLVSNAYIHQRKQDDTFAELDALLSNVEKQGAVLHIVDEETPIAQKLDALGGIGALLRFRV